MLALCAFVIIALAATGWFGPIGSSSSSARTSTATASTSPRATATTRATTLTFTEEQLTEEARRYMPLTVSGITVNEPRVRLEPGRMRLTATGRAFLFSGPVVVVASPTLTNGVPGARVESATFAGMALPDAAKEDIARAFSDVLRANIPAGVRVTAITVRTGALVVETSAA